MANITEILGTDSLSASRPTINSNFQLLNDEIADITSLLDPQTQTLSGVTDISAESLALNAQSGGNTLPVASIDSTQADFSVDAQFTGNFKAAGAVIKSGKQGTASAGASALTTSNLSHATYMITATLDLPAGKEVGQEVTIINVAANVGGSASPVNVIATGVGSGLATGNGDTNNNGNIQLDGVNSTVTLRYLSDGVAAAWYIISGHEYTIL